MESLRSRTLPLRRLHRRILRHRRPLAAITAAGAVLAGLHVLSPPPPETVTVWTIAGDRPGGEVLRADDLTRTHLSPAAVPAHPVEDPDQVLGRTLAAPMSRGEVLTTVRVVAPGLLDGYPGTAAVPLRVTDAAAADLLRVGDRVSFVVADPDGRTTPELLLRGVPVVALPRAREDTLSGGTPGRLVVAAVPTESAAEVAAAAATSILIPVWTR